MHLEIMKMLIDEYTQLSFKIKNVDYIKSIATIDQQKDNSRIDQMLYDFKTIAKDRIKREIIYYKKNDMFNMRKISIKETIGLEKLKIKNDTEEDNKAFFHRYLHNSLQAGKIGYTGGRENAILSTREEGKGPGRIKIIG